MTARPGDVAIRRLLVGNQDLTPSIYSAHIEESLFAPTVLARIMIVGQQGLQGILTGEQNVQFTFSHPDGQERSYQLALNNAGFQSPTRNQSGRMLMLEGVSQHAVRSQATAYQRAFQGKQLSQVVKTIFEEGLGINIPFNIDDTAGVLDTILSEQSPLAHMHRLTQRAIGQNGNTDGFLLFSGIGSSGGEELNFRSIWNLMKQGIKHTITNLNIIETGASLDMGLTFNNILEYTIPAQMRSVDAVQAFNTNSNEYDIASGTYRTATTQLAQQEFPSGNPGLARTEQQWANYNGRRRFSAITLSDATLPESRQADYAGKTRALMTDLQQSFTRFRIPGNSEIRLGDIIDLQLRENTGQSNYRDTRFSGKNIITSVVSYIGPRTNSLRYTTTACATNIETYNGTIG